MRLFLNKRVSRCVSLLYTNVKGIICQGYLPNIKGAIPPIQNLLSVAPPRRTSSDLSRYHPDASGTLRSCSS